MNTATHSVEVPFPQAFAAPLAKSSPFPSAPRYGHASPQLVDRPPTVRWECVLQRGSTLSIRQVAHTQVATLVLLPTGTIYRGTQRNTIGLSSVQRSRTSILQQAGTVKWNGLESSFPLPSPKQGTIFHPLVQTQGLSNPRFCNTRKWLHTTSRQPATPRASYNHRALPKRFTHALTMLHARSPYETPMFLLWKKPFKGCLHCRSYLSEPGYTYAAISLGVEHLYE